ncbi:5113_t:CDS:2 [Funneliformis mosseae]|uniref:5113_t:CDS:1 n=1 Tax=Funneliformis mosseae TaxID=27381 RepID=A0A9N9BK80_FUNMO|nr:5113_t:CDS:2 [Funneliformis mosseae]
MNFAVFSAMFKGKFQDQPLLQELGLPADLFGSDQLCKNQRVHYPSMLSKLTKHIVSNLSDWKEFLSTDPAETCVPVCWDSGSPASVVQLRKILLERFVIVLLVGPRSTNLMNQIKDFAIYTIDTWLDSVAQAELIFFLINSLGKLCLTAYLPMILNIHTLVDVEGSDNLITPEGIKLDHFMNWMKSLSDDDEVAYTQESSSESSAQLAWMRDFYSSVENWMKLLPGKLTSMNRTETVSKNPLFRFFDREIK